MKAQTIFNKVSKHLLKQNKQSENEDGRCLYRGPFGLRCAIGAIIPNRLYKEKFNGEGIECVFDENKDIRNYLGEENEDLLGALQSIHDTCLPSGWYRELKRTAELFNLEFKH